MAQISAAARSIGWRTPAMIILCGCLVSLLGFGPRSAFGFFLTPMSQANGWGRDVFALALAIQMLLWGVGQPFAGAIADRFGTLRALIGGALVMGAVIFDIVADTRAREGDAVAKAVASGE